MGGWENVIRLLGDDTRRGIIKQLLVHDRCVRALACAAGVSEAAVSQHLRLLREAGLVTGEKRGYFMYYKVNRVSLLEAADALRDMVSQTGPEQESKP